MQNVKNILICRNKRGKEECKYRAKSGWELNCSNSGWIDCCCCCCSGESSAAQLLAGGQVTTLSQLKYKKVSKYFPSLNSGFFQVLSWETFESPEAWILNWTYAWVKTFDQGKIYNNISLLSKSVRKCEVAVKEQMHSWSCCWLKRGAGCYACCCCCCPTCLRRAQWAQGELRTETLAKTCFENLWLSSIATICITIR